MPLRPLQERPSPRRPPLPPSDLRASIACPNELALNRVVFALITPVARVPVARSVNEGKPVRGRASRRVSGKKHFPSLTLRATELHVDHAQTAVGTDVARRLCAAGTGLKLLIRPRSIRGYLVASPPRHRADVWATGVSVARSVNAGNTSSGHALHSLGSFRVVPPRSDAGGTDVARRLSQTPASNSPTIPPRTAIPERSASRDLLQPARLFSLNAFSPIGRLIPVDRLLAPS